MKDYNKKVIGGKTYDRWGEISGKNSDLNTEDAVAAFEKKGYSVKTYRIPDGKGTYEIWIRKKTPAKSR
jgi:hypothetical protein